MSTETMSVQSASGSTRLEFEGKLCTNCAGVLEEDIEDLTGRPAKVKCNGEMVLVVQRYLGQGNIEFVNQLVRDLLADCQAGHPGH